MNGDFRNVYCVMKTNHRKDLAPEQPRSQGFLLAFPTERERETGRRENLGTRLAPELFKSWIALSTG